MVTHHFHRIHGDVHWAHDRARAIRFAGGLRALDGKHTEQVRDAQHGTVRTGIFTPGSFNEDRKSQGQTQNGKGAPCDFRAPEVEQGEVWIVCFKDQRATPGRDI